MRNVFLIGVAKCGTTSLHDTLCKAPGVAGTVPKESRLLENPSYDPQGLLSSVDNSGDFDTIVESSPSSCMHPVALHNLSKYHPGAPVILLVRDPVRRAFSDWWMMYGRGREPRTFAVALAEELDRLKRVGRVSSTIDYWAHRYATPPATRWRHSIYIESGDYVYTVSNLRTLIRSPLLVLEGPTSFKNWSTTVKILSDFLDIDLDGIDQVEQSNVRLSGWSSSIVRRIPVDLQERFKMLLPSFLKRGIKRFQANVAHSVPEPPPDALKMLVDYYRETGTQEWYRNLVEGAGHLLVRSHYEEGPK